MSRNNDELHAGQGEAIERWRFGYARSLFGPRVALALKQAGVFGTALDESEGAT